MDALIKDKLFTDKLSKSYRENEVLHNITFSVKDGEFLSILGPSGCGKTTILRLLIGLADADGGKIYKDGTDITNLPSNKRGMGMVFQNYALFENMSVLKNVEYALHFDETYKNNARERALSVIEQVGLTEHIDARPHRLSGGQQQRVAIARTLALNPDVILLDEPMSALDADTRLTLRAELKDIQKRFGSTMVYITHDQEEAFALSDRIMVMDKGAIQQLDTPENIVKNPANEYVERFVLNNLRIKIDSLMKYAGNVK